MGVTNIPPNINADIKIDRNIRQNNIPTNIKVEINSDCEINKDEIIKIFFETMEINKSSMRKFFGNEQELIKVLRQSDIHLDRERIKKVQRSFLEIKSLLIDNVQLEKEKMRFIHNWYKNYKFDNTSLTYVLFILIVLLGTNKFKTFRS